MVRKGDPGDLGATVALLRALQGWTKKQLADASGVDRSQISRYELGKETPSPRTLERLATTVGLPPYLLPQIEAFIRSLREVMQGRPSSGASTAEPAGLPLETKQAILETLDQVVTQARAELKLYAAKRSASSGTPGSEPAS